MIINSKCQYYFVFDITRWILEEIIEVEHAMVDYYCSVGNNMALCFKSYYISIIINISLFNGGMSNKECGNLNLDLNLKVSGFSIYVFSGLFVMSKLFKNCKALI